MSGLNLFGKNIYFMILPNKNKNKAASSSFLQHQVLITFLIYFTSVNCVLEVNDRVLN